MTLSSIRVSKCWTEYKFHVFLFTILELKSRFKYVNLQFTWWVVRSSLQSLSSYILTNGKQLSSFFHYFIQKNHHTNNLCSQTTIDGRRFSRMFICRTCFVYLLFSFFFLWLLAFQTGRASRFTFLIVWLMDDDSPLQ